MSSTSVKFLYVMLFVFKKGKNAAQTAKEIREVIEMIQSFLFYLCFIRTINKAIYYAQLDLLKAVIEGKRLGLVNRKSVIFHQDPIFI